jgi:hypothetical protein
MWLRVFLGNHIGDDGARVLLEAVRKSSSPFLKRVRLHGVQLAVQCHASPTCPSQPASAMVTAFAYRELGNREQRRRYH